MLKHKKPLDTMIGVFWSSELFQATLESRSSPGPSIFFWQVRTHVGQATLRILQPDADLCANTQRIEEGRPVGHPWVMSIYVPIMPECVIISLLTCKSWKNRKLFLECTILDVICSRLFLSIWIYGSKLLLLQNTQLLTRLKHDL